MAKILFISSEAVPFAKTGGLADVSGTLPIELRRLGHEVTLILPAYQSIYNAGLPVDDVMVDVEVPIGNRLVSGRVWRSHLPNSDVPVYFVGNDDYFDRPGLYGNGKEDYRDNCERFVFFCRAVMESIRVLELDVQILHCNDWQTGLVPVYLNIEYGLARGYSHLRTIMTIHNLAYQGRFWHWDMLLTGLDWSYFNWRQLEFYGDLNLLKAGLVFADLITTVSPRYAQEIQLPPLGCGLEGVLASRKRSLFGILNGADYSVWNPQTDPYLPRNYGPGDWQSGKAACKAELQAQLGLANDPQACLFGFVGRLAEQKGVDLIVSAMEHWVPHRRSQWALLGTGSLEYELRLTELSREFPNQIAARLDFSDELAHRIEAGADVFLMPSRYEPCGLSQLFSLKYGTVPLVHRTGGLEDTIRDVNPENLQRGEANGFVFSNFSLADFEDALGRAIGVYEQDPATWERIVRYGMSQDWSWRRSALQYGEIYDRLLATPPRTALQ